MLFGYVLKETTEKGLNGLIGDSSYKLYFHGSCGAGIVFNLLTLKSLSLS